MAWPLSHRTLRFRQASAAVAATIAPAFDASKRYVRMPVIRATNAPSTIGTWCVGVCESSRHDWPNPDPDFARVASMVHSPPSRHPSMPGHSRIGTIFEPKAPHDKRDVARAETIGLKPSFPPTERLIWGSQGGGCLYANGRMNAMKT